VRLASEQIEFFGGNGYIEASGLPNISRDAQVTAIWEGTTNVLCYDFLRAFGKDNIDKLESFAKWFRNSIRKVLESDSNIVNTVKGVREACHSIILSFNNLYADLHDIITDAKNLPKYERNLRNICFSISRVYIGTLLGLFCIHSGLTKDVYIFTEFVGKSPVYQRHLAEKTKMQLDNELMKTVAMDTDEKTRHDFLKKDVNPKLLVRPKL